MRKRLHFGISDFFKGIFMFLSGFFMSKVAFFRILSNCFRAMLALLFSSFRSSSFCLWIPFIKVVFHIYIIYFLNSMLKVYHSSAQHLFLHVQYFWQEFHVVSYLTWKWDLLPLGKHFLPWRCYFLFSNPQTGLTTLPQVSKLVIFGLSSIFWTKDYPTWYRRRQFHNPPHGFMQVAYELWLEWWQPLAWACTFLYISSIPIIFVFFVVVLVVCPCCNLFLNCAHDIFISCLTVSYQFPGYCSLL